MTKNTRRSSRQSTDTAAALGGDARARAVAWLQKRGSPRLVMSLMLASTIGCGFLSSVAMHGLSVRPLWRYPLAVLVAWAVFLGLVSVWVWWQRRQNEPAPPSSARSARDSGSSWTDGFGGGSGGSSSGSSGSGGGSSWGGGGGRFGGGGASESFAEGPSDGFASGFMSGGGSGGGGGSKGGGWGIDLDGDGDFILLLIGIVVVAAAVFGVAFYAVYSAPTFFAELLIDGGVGTWLYKRADVANRPDWLTTAVRRSVWPVLILLAVFIALAMVMHSVAPAATTVGEAWRMVGNK